MLVEDKELESVVEEIKYSSLEDIVEKAVDEDLEIMKRIYRSGIKMAVKWLRG